MSIWAGGCSRFTVLEVTGRTFQNRQGFFLIAGVRASLFTWALPDPTCLCSALPLKPYYTD